MICLCVLVLPVCAFDFVDYGYWNYSENRTVPALPYVATPNLTTACAGALDGSLVGCDGSSGEECYGIQGTGEGLPYGEIFSKQNTIGAHVIEYNDSQILYPYTYLLATCYKAHVDQGFPRVFARWTNSMVSPGSPPTLGTITTYVQAVDGQSSGAIYGSNIQIHNKLDGSWVNTTNDDDGTSSITSNQSATLDIYAQAIGYASASRTGLTPGDIVYELIMWPTTALLAPGANNVNLIIIVDDRLTATPIQSASVSVTIPTGATTGGSTNSAGTETFVAPNKSVIHVTVSKSGYVSASKIITTSDFGPDTLRVELTKATVTPTITATPLPGEVTARPTLDQRTDNQKDADMMNQIRDAGPGLVGLAILATVMGLIKLMMK